MLKTDVIQALGSTPVVLSRLLRGLSEEELRAGHDDGAGTWSIKEVLVHLRDADEVTLQRFNQMAREETPFLAAYDQEAYARDRGYQNADAAAALVSFVEGRARTVAFFEELPEAELARGGTHEENGLITIDALVQHTVAHDMDHLAQIARGLADGA